MSFMTQRLHPGLAALCLLASLGCGSVSAATLEVPARYRTIQAAINAADAGDVINVQAGRVYRENLVLKYKPGNDYITIQSSALTDLPLPGNRVAPADAAYMPRVEAANFALPVIRTELTRRGAAHHYKLIGLEIARPAGDGVYHNLIMLESEQQDDLAKVPHNFIIDRCYVHGRDGSSTRRGLYLGSRDTQILNSYFSQLHEVGADSQAILGVNGPGGYRIANNYLEAASENVLFGGSDPLIPDLVPSDIVIEHNYFHKPLAWRQAIPKWTVKNLFELKNARNVTVQNNIFENNWAEAQDGSAILFTVRNQDGGAPWSVIENVVFRYNLVTNVGNFLQMLTADNLNRSASMNSVDVSNNLVMIAGAPLGSTGKAVQFNRGRAGAQGENYVFSHNTFIHQQPQQRFIQIEQGDTDFMPGLVIDANIITTLEGSTGGIFGGDGQGTHTLDYASPAWSFSNNAMRQDAASLYPEASEYPAGIDAYAFEDVAEGDFRLKPESPYYQRAENGKDIGADIDELNLRIACVRVGNCADALSNSSSAR